MCINQQNTSKAEIDKVKALAEEVTSPTLKVFLEGLATIVEQGKTVCGMGMRASEEEAQNIIASLNGEQPSFAPQQQSLPPGIHPPNRQQPDSRPMPGNYL